MFRALLGWRKASKCEKLLKLVQCRLKLRMSQRESIVTILRNDVAELLRNGEETRAFSRVEVLLKEKDTLRAYDLLYKCGEFLMSQLAYIRKHRKCPSNIMEAISNLIFATSRCADLPELKKLRKLFRERYGDAFVIASAELHPGTPVNRQISENLCSRIISCEEKSKLIEEIGKECGIPHETIEAKDNSKLQHQQVVDSSGKVDVIRNDSSEGQVQVTLDNMDATHVKDSSGEKMVQICQKQVSDTVMHPQENHASDLLSNNTETIENQYGLTEEYHKIDFDDVDNKQSTDMPQIFDSHLINNDESEANEMTKFNLKHDFNIINDSCSSGAFVSFLQDKFEKKLSREYSKNSAHLPEKIVFLFDDSDCIQVTVSRDTHDKERIEVSSGQETYQREGICRETHDSDRFSQIKTSVRITRSPRGRREAIDCTFTRKESNCRSSFNNDNNRKLGKRFCGRTVDEERDFIEKRRKRILHADSLMGHSNNFPMRTIGHSRMSREAKLYYGETPEYSSTGSPQFQHKKIGQRDKHGTTLYIQLNQDSALKLSHMTTSNNRMSMGGKMKTISCAKVWQRKSISNPCGIHISLECSRHKPKCNEMSSFGCNCLHLSVTMDCSLNSPCYSLAHHDKFYSIPIRSQLEMPNGVRIPGRNDPSYDYRTKQSHVMDTVKREKTKVAGKVLEPNPAMGCHSNSEKEIRIQEKNLQQIVVIPDNQGEGEERTLALGGCCSKTLQSHPSILHSRPLSFKGAALMLSSKETEGVTATTQPPHSSSLKSWKSDDILNRSCRVVHPKLPDYDDIVAKFKSLKEEYMRSVSVKEVSVI